MANRVTETLYRVRDGATAVVRRISNAFRSNAATAEQSTTRIEAANRRQRSSLSGVAASVGRLRFAYFAVAGAVVGLVRSASQWTKAASDQEQAEAKLSTAIRNGAGATQEEIQALQDLAAERQKVTRFGDEQTISAQAQLATFKLNADQIAQLVPRVQDLAEGTRRLGRSNVDLEQSAILVGKAITGNAGELSRYGVVLTETQRELIRTGDQSQKVATLAEALDANFKGLATSLPPFELALQSTNNGLGDFGEKLGAAITQSPAMVNVLNRIRDTFAQWGTAVERHGGTINRVITGLSGTFRGTFNAISITVNTMIVLAAEFAAAWVKGAKAVTDAIAALPFGSISEKAQEFSNRAAEALEDLEKRSASAYDRIGRASAGWLDAARDVNDALFQNEKAQKAANEAQEQAIQQTLGQAEAEETRQAALEATRGVLERLGVDAERVNTGVSTSARETIEALITMGEAGEQTAAVMAAAGRKAAEAFSDREVVAYERALLDALDAGRITADVYADLSTQVFHTHEEAAEAQKTFARLRQEIARADDGQAFKNLKEQVDELGQSGAITKEQYQELLELLKLLEGEYGDVGAGADDAGDKGEDAGDKTGDSFEDAGKKAGDAADQVEKVGDKAEEAGRSSAGMAASIGGVLNDVRSISEGASQAVDDLVQRLDGVQSVTVYFEKLFEGLGRIQKQYESQVEAVDEIEDRLARGADAADVYNAAVLAATKSTQLLDQQRLDRLNEIIGEARRQMEQARAETRRWIDDIDQAADAAERRVRELRGEREQLEVEDQQATIRELEKKIREAGALGVDTPPAVLEDLKRRLDAEKEVLDILREQAEEAEAERKRSAQESRQGPSRASGAGSAPQDAQNATGAPAPGLPGSGQVFTINLAIGGRQFPGQFSTADARALAEILRRSGNNTLPNQAP